MHHCGGKTSCRYGEVHASQSDSDLINWASLLSACTVCKAADVLLRVYSSQAARAQMIKETMDKKFGAPWHVVAGGYFSYDITFEVRCVCCPQSCTSAGGLRCKKDVECSARICFTFTLVGQLECCCGRCRP